MRARGAEIFAAILVFAAAAPTSPAEAAFSGAKYAGKPFCPKGTHFDPRKGGECWSCNGRERTLAPITSGEACERPAYERFRAADLKTPTGKIVKSKCPKRYKLDAIAGTCYRCAWGWHRSIFSVKEGKACYRRVEARYYKAQYVRKFGCSGSQFFDPRKGGQCWSCPTGYIRTVSPVTGKRACTNRVADIFAADKGKMCRRVIAQMRKGTDGARKFLGDMNKLTRPVAGQINALMSKMSPQVKSPKKLTDLLAKLTRPMDAYRPEFQRLARFAGRGENLPGKIKQILFDPRLMCDGKPGEFRRAVQRGGLMPIFTGRKASLMDGWFVRSAHAASPGLKPVGAIFATVGGRRTVDPLGIAVTVTGILDTYGEERVYVSIGPLFSSQPGFGLSVGWLSFLKANISDFGGIKQLGVGIGINLSKDALEKNWWKGLGWKAAPLRVLSKAQINFSLDPAIIPNLVTGKTIPVPGFGNSWTLLSTHWTGPVPASLGPDSVEELEKRQKPKKGVPLEGVLTVDVSATVGYIKDKVGGLKKKLGDR